MGYGARIAFGCNIGAYFGGIASFSLHGWLWGVMAIVGTFAGLALRPPARADQPEAHRLGLLTHSRPTARPGAPPGRAVVINAVAQEPDTLPHLPQPSGACRVPDREERDMSMTVLDLSADHTLSTLSWSTHTDARLLPAAPL
jgi:hypothetical protein